MLVSEDTPVPTPYDWAKLYTLLVEAWNSLGDPAVRRPPVPLILAGAAFSSAVEIRRRWKDLVSWANEFGFSELLAAHLPEMPEVDVAEAIAGVGADGSTWWHESSYHEPSPRPSTAAVATGLKHLAEHWAAIVGVELGRSTRPIRFTGRKFRRLVVAADPDYSPPWGSWSAITGEPESFATFRRAVNSAIAPVEVDHVVFITERWKV